MTTLRLWCSAAQQASRRRPFAIFSVRKSQTSPAYSWDCTTIASAPEALSWTAKVPQAGVSPSFWPECPLRLPHHALTGLSRALTHSHGPLSHYQSPVSPSSPPLLAQHCSLPAFANKTRRTDVENLRAFAFHDSYRGLGPLRTLHILDSHIALPGSPYPSRPNLVSSRSGKYCRTASGLGFRWIVSLSSFVCLPVLCRVVYMLETSYAELRGSAPEPL